MQGVSVENVSGDGNNLFSRLHQFIASDITQNNADFLINTLECLKMYN
jgi:hypothetical protein